MIWTDEGWLFLAVVIDLFSRRVIGWSLRPDLRSGLVEDALRMAWGQRVPGHNAGLLFHSDRGSQYASDGFQQVLQQFGIQPSMSRKGDCWPIEVDQQQGYGKAGKPKPLSNFPTATTTTNVYVVMRYGF